MKQLFIRADMNKIIATGHVFRCLSIADEAKSRGIETVFISADKEGENLFLGKGYENIVLDSSFDKLDDEISQMKTLIQKRNIKCLIVDSYYVTDKYLRALSLETDVFYIDDLRSFDYPVKGIIAYVNYYRKLEKEGYQALYKLFGPKYVPLRKEFRLLKEKEIRKDIKKILILSGGSDNFNIKSRMLKKIKEKGDWEITLICGKYSPDYEALKEEYSEDERVIIYKTVDNLKDYFSETDLVITAAGSTVYEISAVGVPAISYTFADNQLDNALSFDENGLISYAGDVRKDDIFSNTLRLIDLYKDEDYRLKLSGTLQKLVDGYGAKRIVDELEKLY